MSTYSTEFSAIRNRSIRILEGHTNGQYTRPASGVYPHQWLWDSCFVALGLARLDARAATMELLGLLRGQWSNGMMPHMIYSTEAAHCKDAALWHTQRLSPPGVRTSGITQPPMLAIAAEVVARELPETERQAFLRQIWPATVRYHHWLYYDRDPAGTGLVALLHPWESGMDDTPSWDRAMEAAPKHTPGWNYASEVERYDAGQRVTIVSARRMMGLLNVMTQYRYDGPALIRSSPVVIRDLAFNSILAAANESLARLAALGGFTLPEQLTRCAARTRMALAQLWHEPTGQYLSYDDRRESLIQSPTVAMFLPLLAGVASEAQARQLVTHLADPNRFGLKHALPSVPADAPDFEPTRYWRGPVWVNINWLVIRGLERYGYTAEAAALRHDTLELVRQSGTREYFDPLTGRGLGAHEFAWTAALAVDLTTD